MKKKWVYINKDEEAVSDLIRGGLSVPLSAALSSRGIKSMDEAEEFLFPDPLQLHDPFLMKDMDKAVKRIKYAIDRMERIIVYGDYDVDGVTATSLMVLYLRELGADISYYIPERENEGYGLNKDALLYLKEKGADLILTVDCGISSVEEIDYANEIGLDVVITDHHECQECLPHAFAVVNPKRPDCGYPFAELAGVGVAFKLICALNQKGKPQYLLNKYSDLVAIGTIADVMSITKENRVIVSYGLKRLNHTPRMGLSSLFKLSGIDKNKNINTSTIGYNIAPKINAAGRLSKAGTAVELLLSNNMEECSYLAEELCRENKRRQEKESGMIEQALSMYNSVCTLRKNSVVLYSEDWHQGVIGIVASRIVSKLRLPTILISLDGDMGKGSGRSIEGFDMFGTLDKLSPLLDKFGGHEMAAGLSICKDNLERFCDEFEQIASRKLPKLDNTPVIYIEDVLNPNDLTLRTAQEIQLLEPFGTDNYQPVFEIKALKIGNIIPLAGNRHIKLELQSEDSTYTGLFFGAGTDVFPFAVGDIIDAAFNLEINNFRGRCTLQLNIKDIKLSPDMLLELEKSKQLYTDFKNRVNLNKQKLKLLLPNRNDFAVVYRYIKANSIEDELKEPLDSFYRRVNYTSGTFLTYAKTMVILDVFCELKILNVTLQDNIAEIIQLPILHKADLSKSVLLKDLSNERINI